MIRNHRIYLTVPYAQKDLAKDLTGAQWHQTDKQWSWPVVIGRVVMATFPWCRAKLGPALEEYQQARLKAAYGMQKLRDDLKDSSQFNLDAALSDVEVPESGFLLAPYTHQLKMLKCGLKYPLWAFFAEMGTGKTKVIIDLLRIKSTFPALIICPKSVMYSWGKEIEKNSRLGYRIIKGTAAKRLKLLAEVIEGGLIAIINYEGVVATKDYGCWDRFVHVTLDESSRIKNHKAKCTKIITKLFTKCPNKYILSGTPITQGPRDIYAQMAFLSPDFLGFGSFYAFRNTYCNMGGYGGYEIVSYKNLDDLKTNISRHSITLKKEDVLDLPEKTYHVRQLDMSPEIERQYKSMKKDLIVEISQDETLTAPIILTKILRLQQILAGGFVEPKKNPKLLALEETLKEIIDSGKQAVVWTRFKRSYEIVADLCQRKEYSYSSVTGDTKDSGPEIERFQAAQAKVIICQVTAGGFGITLTASNVAIYYENDFSLEKRKQSEDRIHRVGQDLTCNYIDLVYRDTIDETVLAAIGAKQDISLRLVESFKRGEY